MQTRLAGPSLAALAVAFLFAGPHSTTAAQAQAPTVDAFAEPLELVIGEEFRVVLEVNGARSVERVIVPELFDFAVCINRYDPAVEVKVGDPASGAAGNRVTLSYVFLATRVGLFEMRPFRIVADGVSLETDAIAVFVGGSADPVVTARVEPSRVNVGDEFRLTAEIVGSESLFHRFVPPDVFDFAEYGGGGSGSDSHQNWSMRAVEPGEWVIPPVRVEDRGRTYDGEPVTIVITDEPIAIEARTDLQSESIWVGGEFSLRLLVTGVHELDEDPGHPELGGFAELLNVEAPWRFTANGEKQTWYDYRLRAVRAGSFEIGPMKILADGREVETDPLTVVIDEEATGEADPPDNLALEGTLGKTRAYVGEPVRVDYTVVHAGNQRRPTIGTRSFPTFAGFDVFEPGFRGFRPEGSPADGRTAGLILRRAGLLPRQSGRLELGTATVEVRVEKPRDMWGDPREYERDYVSHIFTSEPLALEVLPLPAEGRPASFRGHVGTLDVTSRVDRTRVAVGETVTLRVKVLVAGYVEGLPDPEIEFQNGFSVSEPEINTVFADDRDRLRGEREYTYSLTGVSPGTYRIPAVEMSWFDAGTESYGTSRSHPFTITVVPAGEGR